MTSARSNLTTVCATGQRMTFATPSQALPHLPYGRAFLGLMRKAIGCQIVSGITDEESRYVQLHIGDELEQALRAHGLREDWLLSIRDRTKNPVTTSNREDIQKAMARITGIFSPGGPSTKILQVKKCGDIVSHGELVNILGGSTSQNAQAGSIIRDLLDQGMLQAVTNRGQTQHYLITKRLIHVTPYSEFIDEQLRNIARQIRYKGAEDDRKFGWSVRLCSAGVEDLMAYLESGEIEEHFGLAAGHDGGEPNAGCLITAAPIGKNQNWEHAADRTIGDTITRNVSSRRLAISLASLSDEWFAYYSGSGASEAYDKIKGATRSFRSRGKTLRDTLSYGIGFFFSDLNLL